MDINMAELRSLETERDIPLRVLIPAIEQAMRTAYERTPGAQPFSRVELDRKTGHVTVWAQERDEEGSLVREWDDTPRDFGRIAAATARQVIVLRLRDAEDAQVVGTFQARENDIVTGTVVGIRDTRVVHIDLGEVEGILPIHEQIPGEVLTHGE
ncbi:MAG: transcription termination/antitermination protein NusA, partial [Bifidobacteriaceae bacterium]|nr:transcription termination/antitermination protein NusA [Bifidobacteriaceae bacterium]